MAFSRFFWFFFFIAIPFRIPAQETSLEKGNGRPKLGLSLSGGGAKGFAHIGVLKVLEEVGLRPDYITGTSMGSIVGGLYAMGYSADSLHQIVRNQDWNQVLSDNLPLSEVILEEKRYFNNEFLELPIDGWTVRPPSGLVEGQQIMELLSYLTMPAYGVDEFAALPIPFQCVAADVVKGEYVVLKEGVLMQAMRTSMAIPTVFTAIQRDTQVLVDGGVIRNFPVEEVVNMGAERVIGAYTGAVRKNKNELYSFNQILGQLAFLMSLEDAQNQFPYLDIYIEPDLSAFSAADFGRYEAIIDAGEQAARQHYVQLKALASELNSYGPQPELQTFPPIEAIVIDEIRITGNSLLSDQDIMGRARIEPGDIIPVEDFARIVENLFGTNLFDLVTFSLTKEGQANVLHINCKEKLTRTLSTALIYDSYTNAGFLVSATWRNALFDADRLMLIGRFTDHYRARLNYLKYLNRNRTVMGVLDWHLQKDRLPILQDGVEQNIYRMVSSRFKAGLQRRFGTNFLMEISAGLEQLEYHPVSGPDALVLDQIDGRLLELSGKMEWNSLNTNVFPTRGVYFSLESGINLNNQWRVMLHEDSNGGALPDSIPKVSNYGKVRLIMDAFLPVNKRGSIRLSPFVGALFNHHNNFSEFFLVGGPEHVSSRSIPLFGLDPHEVPVQLALGCRVGYQQFVNENLMFSVDINAGGFAVPEVLTLSGSGRTSRPNVFLGGSQIGVGYKTIVGPIRFYVMLPFDTDTLTDSRLRTYLTFGYRF